MDSGRLAHLSYDHLREPCKQHGYNRKDAKDVLKTRLASMQDEQAGSTQDVQGNLDAPVTETGKIDCPPADVVDHLHGPTFAPDRRRKRDALRAAFVADEGVVKERAQWRTSKLKSQVEFSRSSTLGGVEAAISA